MTNWENSGGDQGYPLERPSKGDFRDPDVEPEVFDAQLEREPWPWSERLPVGGEI